MEKYFIKHCRTIFMVFIANISAQNSSKTLVAIFVKYPENIKKKYNVWKISANFILIAKMSKHIFMLHHTMSRQVRMIVWECCALNSMVKHEMCCDLYNNSITK